MRRLVDHGAFTCSLLLAGAAALAFCTGTMAQDAKGSPGHIKAVTSAV